MRLFLDINFLLLALTAQYLSYTLNDIYLYLIILLSAAYLGKRLAFIIIFKAFQIGPVMRW